MQRSKCLPTPPFASRFASLPFVSFMMPAANEVPVKGIAEGYGMPKYAKYKSRVYTTQRSTEGAA
jgi:hypothetical protein